MDRLKRSADASTVRHMSSYKVYRVRFKSWGTRFQIQKRRTSGNFLAPLFLGEVVSKGDATEIVGSFGPRWFAVIFGTAIVLLVLYSLARGLLIDDKGASSRHALLVYAIVVVVLATTLIKAWKREVEYLMSFLKACCENREPRLKG